MNYSALRSKHQAEFSNFPMIFAFNQSQLDEGLKKLGVVDTALICSIGGGGYIKKADFDDLELLVDRHGLEMDEAMKDREFLTGAIEYELGNHEYGYTGNPNSALNALGIRIDSAFREECFAAAQKAFFIDNSAGATS